MALLNAVLRFACDWMLAPFAGLPALVSLSLVSLLTSIGMLLVFKRTSRQGQLADVKRRIHACLFEIRLFSDDLRAILRAQMEILRHNATYLRLSLAPMVWIMPPLALVIAQLQFHYGYAGLRPGQSAVLAVDLAAPRLTRPTAELDLPAGLRVEAGPVWIPTLAQLAWRVVAEREGRFELAVTVAGGERATKTVAVTQRLVRVSPRRVGASWLDQFLYPAEPPLAPASGLRSISLTYPAREVSVLGFHWQWMIPFFGLSIVFAFALRGLFKVTI
jgi:uncharacterized membrane protein (DUF106 family)